MQLDLRLTMWLNWTAADKIKFELGIGKSVRSRGLIGYFAVIKEFCAAPLTLSTMPPVTLPALYPFKSLTSQLAPACLAQSTWPCMWKIENLFTQCYIITIMALYNTNGWKGKSSPLRQVFSKFQRSLLHTLVCLAAYSKRLSQDIFCSHVCNWQMCQAILKI